MNPQIVAGAVGVAIAVSLTACGGGQQNQSQMQPQQGGYPPQQGGYPPQQGGYPPQQGGYPPQQGGYPPQQGGYPQQGGQPPPGGAPAPTAAPGAGAPAPAPAPTTPQIGQDGPLAQQIDAAAAAPAAQLLATQHQGKIPPGAKKVGGLIAGNFRQGQKLETMIPLTMGKCYTVVASGVGVQEVNIQLLSPIPNAPPLAVDKDSGPNAVMAPAPSCYRPLLPVPQAKVVIMVPAGTGMVAAQIYEK